MCDIFLLWAKPLEKAADISCLQWSGLWPMSSTKVNKFHHLNLRSCEASFKSLNVKRQAANISQSTWPMRLHFLHLFHSVYTFLVAQANVTARHQMHLSQSISWSCSSNFSHLLMFQPPAPIWTLLMLQAKRRMIDVMCWVGAQPWNEVFHLPGTWNYVTATLLEINEDGMCTV